VNGPHSFCPFGKLTRVLAAVAVARRLDHVPALTVLSPSRHHFHESAGGGPGFPRLTIIMNRTSFLVLGFRVKN
jgi:hypothetical protein